MDLLSYPKDNKDDAKKFILYSVMGVFTNVIFWGTEIVIDNLFAHPNAKHLEVSCAVIGLSIE